jgi:hypothetical protein
LELALEVIHPSQSPRHPVPNSSTTSRVRRVVRNLSRITTRPALPSERRGEPSLLLLCCAPESERPRVAHLFPAAPALHPHESSILTTLRPQSSCDSDGSSRERGHHLFSLFRQWATYSLGDPSLHSANKVCMRRRLASTILLPFPHSGKSLGEH